MWLAAFIPTQYEEDETDCGERQHDPEAVLDPSEDVGHDAAQCGPAKVPKQVVDERRVAGRKGPHVLWHRRDRAAWMSVK